MKSEQGTVRGPGQPEHVWSRVRGANMLRDSRLKPALPVGLGWRRQAGADTDRDGGVHWGWGLQPTKGRGPAGGPQSSYQLTPCRVQLSQLRPLFSFLPGKKGASFRPQPLVCTVGACIPSHRGLCRAWKPSKEAYCLEVGSA